MPIQRDARHSDNFTILSNRLLGDTRLSFKARGLLGYVLSKPGHWTARVEELMKAGNCGRESILSALRELEDVGYLVRTKKRDDLGRWVPNQVIRETSIHDEESLGDYTSPQAGFPPADAPTAEEASS